MKVGLKYDSEASEYALKQLKQILEYQKDDLSFPSACTGEWSDDNSNGPAELNCYYSTICDRCVFGGGLEKPTISKEIAIKKVP